MRTTTLYALVIAHEFRWTLLTLLIAASIGTIVFACNPVEDGGVKYPTIDRAVYGAWMALLAQPFFTPGPWYVGLINSVFPLLGFVLIGEGIIRFGLLMLSRRRGEKEWMNVMASTYRDHVILAGLGHLGYRVFEQLLAADVDVVVIDNEPNSGFSVQARSSGAPVLDRDMREDQSLIDAGVEHARAIIICTNDDMANLETALDARRLNPKVRVVMRLFDQRIAKKIAGALSVDVAFSSSALAAPMVAAMSMNAKVLSSVVIAGVPHVVTELKLSDKSALVGKRVDEIEMGYAARVLARTPGSGGSTQSPPTRATVVSHGDTLVVHTATSQLATLASAGAGTAN